MWYWIIFNAVLFFALIPGVVVRLPPHGSMHQQMFVHAVLFAVLHHVLGQALKSYIIQETMENPSTHVDNPCPPYYEKCPSGDCRLASEVHSFCN